MCLTHSRYDFIQNESYVYAYEIKYRLILQTVHLYTIHERWRRHVAFDSKLVTYSYIDIAFICLLIYLQTKRLIKQYQ